MRRSTGTRLVLSLSLCGVLTATVLASSQAAPPSGDGAAARSDAPANAPVGDFFSTVDIDPAATVGAPSVGDNVNHGDLWPNCWADDDHVYTAYGDGVGFGDVYSDIGVARITGTPGQLTGEQLATEVSQAWTPEHSRKPTGMACVDGDLYLAVQDLAFDFNDAPAATIARSTDKGQTWEWDTEAPMFGDGVFTTVMFLDYGKDYANAPDDYVYAYGLDHNWRDSFNDRVPDPVDLYLGRVPKDAVTDRGAWEFVSGTDDSGEPTWSADIADRSPVLHDDRHIYQDVFGEGRVENTTVLSQGGVVYNEGLDRYLYTSWTEYTFEFYESPTPWGPWERFDSRDFGGYPWPTTKHGGYGVTIPSKYISEDGRSMWIQSNVCPCGGGFPPGEHWAYTYSLRQMHVEPRVETEPENAADPAHNLATEPGTTGVERAIHFGGPSVYNDGELTASQDDWNDERKTESWWGYTWPREYTVDRVVYTTGEMFGDGGWFTDAPRVEVRQDGVWTDAGAVTVEPPYPGDASAGPNRSYTLTFPETAGDGVRVIGAPGGDRTFTSIAELEVYYGG
ncbi:DUF4185 domain-containing protein [Streptomyces sedi]|uniref:DUF4185 domain-containing protein n=1 Tax=Streptomyces sedi TaxID=555059 RepID=A0A5C4VCM5_9ACTN|nr:DUF4185 domain-containing protein [Streptomyces sedi]TNM33542.1 DUF4185 domain-containing protein [Streptomyces sedi]